MSKNESILRSIHKPAKFQKLILKVVFFTYHVWRSERRAGFHHLAKSFHDFGWEVLFFTTGLSWLSFLQGNKRLDNYQVHERKN